MDEPPVYQREILDASGILRGESPQDPADSLPPMSLNERLSSVQ